MTDYGLSPRQLGIIHATLAPFVVSIEKAGLFGSRATGKAKPASDVDIVLYGLQDQKILDRIHTLFTESFLPFTVDVQAYDLIHYPPLRNHIDNHMQLLFTQADLLKKTPPVKENHA